ncbi:MAG: hypothetical protein WA821_08680 [Anaerolineales bacterium]
MHIPLLIMNVQVFSLDLDARCLTSNEAILQYDKHAVIKIPLSDAHPLEGGPVIGEQYFVSYMDGIAAPQIYPPEFRYIGAVNEQLVFSNA